MDSGQTLSLHLSQLRNFTKLETSRISALLRVIESSPLRPYLRKDYVIPLRDKSGAVGVVVPQYSGPMLILTTPFVTLPLPLLDDPDASTAESAMSFIKERMGEVRDTIHPVKVSDNPVSAEVRLDELEDQEMLLYALREIAESSEDADSTRTAFIALTTTTLGKSYLEGNPIKL